MEQIKRSPEVALHTAGRLSLGLRHLVIAISIMLPGCLAHAMPQKDEKPANAIQISLPYTSYGASISSPYEIDFYQFSAKAGQDITVWLSLSELGSGLVPVLSFYDGTGKLLAYNDGQWSVKDREYGRDPILYLRIPSNGVYYVSVMAADTFQYQFPPKGGTTGNYDLILFTSFSGIQDQYEPNDDLQHATAVTIPFKSISANLLYLGDTDWFSFEADKGERISIDIDSMELQSGNPGSDPAVRARLGIFDSRGRLLKSTDSGTDPDTGFTGDPAVEFDVPAKGIYYVAVTNQDDSGFVTLFNNPDFLQDPYVSAAENLIGYYTLEIRSLTRFYLPQIANGNFGNVTFTTSILLVNPSDGTTTGSVSFFNSDGTPLSLSLTDGNDQTDTHSFSIPPWGGLVLQTDGLGNGASGYAIVSSPSPVAGSAVFSQFDGQGNLVTEAAVETSSPIDFFSLPVDLTGAYNTGLAIANLEGSTTANLYVKLLNSQGGTVATRTISLDQHKQIAIYVAGPNQLFPGVTGIRGSLQVFSDTPIYAVALRSTPGTLTTLAPTHMNLSYDPTVFRFPHVVTGVSSVRYKTTVILTNPEYYSANGTILFTRSDSSPMNVTIGSDYGARHDFSIPPQGTVFLETSADGELQSGYATLTADHEIGATLVFSQYGPSDGALQSEVTIPASQFYSKFVLFAQNEGPFNTGIAFANTNLDGLTLQCLLHTDGDSEAGSVLLGPNRQRAILLAGKDQLFPAFTGTGTLQVTSSLPIPAVALRLTATTMTALPLFPIP